MKRIIWSLLFILVIFPITVSARNIPIYEDSEYDEYEYVIDSVYVDAVVKDSKTVLINEYVGVFFKEPSYGLRRVMSRKSCIDVSRCIKGYPSKVSVDSLFNVESNEYDTFLNIDRQSTPSLVGYHKYHITYTYNIVEKKLNDDFFFFVLFENNFDTVIGSLDFKIVLPDNYNTSRLKMYVENLRTENMTDLDIDDNVIIGHYDKDFFNNSKLAFEVPIENKTYSMIFGGNNYDSKDIIYMYICIIFGLASIVYMHIVWRKYYKSKGKEWNDFDVNYPPKGLCPLDIDYLYNGKSRAVGETIVHLANRGYIIINKDSKGDYILNKVKDYKLNNETEALLFNSLFKSSDSVRIDGNGILSDFYTEFENIIENKLEPMSADFDRKIRLNLSVMILGFMLMVLGLIKPVCNYTGTIWYSFLLVALGGGFASLVCFGPATVGSGLNIKNRIAVFSVCGVLYYTIWIVIVACFGIQYLYINIFLILVTIILVIYGLKIHKVSVYRERIKEFRNSLREEGDSNTIYMEEMLPYASVLGYRNWYKRCSNRPKWYVGEERFNYSDFIKSVNIKR